MRHKRVGYQIGTLICGSGHQLTKENIVRFRFIQKIFCAVCERENVDRFVIELNEHEDMFVRVRNKHSEP